MKEKTQASDSNTDLYSFHWENINNGGYVIFMLQVKLHIFKNHPVCIYIFFKGSWVFEADMCEKSHRKKNKGVVIVHENLNKSEN